MRGRKPGPEKASKEVRLPVELADTWELILAHKNQTDTAPHGAWSELVTRLLREELRRYAKTSVEEIAGKN